VFHNTPVFGARIGVSLFEDLYYPKTTVPRVMSRLRRFNTIPARDRQTDGWADLLYCTYGTVTLFLHS